MFAQSNATPLAGVRAIARVFIVRCALSCAPPSGDSDDVARDSFYRAFRLIPKGSISYASRRVCYSRRALSRGLKSAPARTSTTLRVVPVGSQARSKPPTTRQSTRLIISPLAPNATVSMFCNAYHYDRRLILSIVSPANQTGALSKGEPPALGWRPGQSLRQAAIYRGNRS